MSARLGGVTAIFFLGGWPTAGWWRAGWTPTLHIRSGCCSASAGEESGWSAWQHLHSLGTLPVLWVNHCVCVRVPASNLHRRESRSGLGSERWFFSRRANFALPAASRRPSAHNGLRPGCARLRHRPGRLWTLACDRIEWDPFDRGGRGRINNEKLTNKSKAGGCFSDSWPHLELGA